jgi:hypothetical protein
VARHRVADTLSEVAIHYPDSHLNGPGLHEGPRPGERMAPDVDGAPFGSGNKPRFALLSDRSPAVDAIIRRFACLVDPELRPPLRDGAIWLIRPDGYVACATNDARQVVAYLERIVR